MVKEKVASQINDLNNETGELKGIYGYKELYQYQDWGENIDDAENGEANYRVGNHEK